MRNKHELRRRLQAFCKHAAILLWVPLRVLDTSMRNGAGVKDGPPGTRTPDPLINSPIKDESDTPD